MKIEDQVKLGMMKNHASFKDLAQNLIGEKVKIFENIVNKYEENISQNECQIRIALAKLTSSQPKLEERVS